MTEEEIEGSEVEVFFLYIYFLIFFLQACGELDGREKV